MQIDRYKDAGIDIHDKDSIQFNVKNIDKIRITIYLEVCIFVLQIY